MAYAYRKISHARCRESFFLDLFMAKEIRKICEKRNILRLFTLVISEKASELGNRTSPSIRRCICLRLFQIEYKESLCEKMRWSRPELHLNSPDRHLRLHTRLRLLFLTPDQNTFWGISWKPRSGGFSFVCLVNNSFGAGAKSIRDKFQRKSLRSAFKTRGEN